MTAKKIAIDLKKAKNLDPKLEEQNNFLKTQKEHKKWYNVRGMGKQLGKPRAVIKEAKKTGGATKHSLRKEK